MGKKNIGIVIDESVWKIIKNEAGKFQMPISSYCKVVLFQNLKLKEKE